MAVEILREKFEPHDVLLGLLKFQKCKAQVIVLAQISYPIENVELRRLDRMILR